LVKNPAERYATAGELADDLRRWLDHQTIKAKPPTLRQKAAKWAVRHTAVVRAAVAALAASALALAISTYIVWKKEVKVQAAYQRALNHLRTARQAADEMLTQAADRLFDVPRMETARLALLQQAVRIYDSFLMEYRDDPALRLEAGLAATRLGGINYDLGRHAEAEQAFRQSITLLQALAADSPADAECQRHLARSFRKFGSYLSDKDRAHRADAEHNLREAAGIWKRLVSAQPTDAHDQARLAETYGVLALAIARQEGRSQEGEDMYRNALGLIDRLPPDVGREPSVRWAYAETSRNLAGLLGARYKLPEEQETLTRRALKVYEERLAESGSPPSRAARDGMGFCYSNLGEMAFGRRELRESETLFRKAFDLYAQLANDFPHFEAYASRLFKRTQRLTDVLCLDGRDDEAEAVVRQFENLWQGLSAIHPDQQAHARGLVDCYLGLPANLVGAGRLAEAVSYYREAVRLKPDSYESHISLGNALSKRGLLDEATAVYREAIRLKPNYEPTRYNLSLVLARKGLFGEAIAEGREAIRILPKHAGVHIQLARLLATCPDPVYRNPAQAVEVANRAVELTPANGNAWNAVGIARYHSGDWKGAIEALQKGNDLPNGGRGGDFFYLAMAHWQLGEKDQARQWYDKAVQWTDKNEPRNEGLRLYRTEAAALLGIADPPKTGDK
jgi:tetratricopeptide (TPR) repeat protein